MLIITISIDDIDELYKIGAIRIKPKFTPKADELCTYKLIKFQNNKQIDLHKNIKCKYGDALVLTQKILEACKNAPHLAT